MKPTDLRNASWRECLTHVTDDMVRVHNAWLQHGPCTTRELAERAKMSLLTLRPRTTDLGKLGLVQCTAAAGNEGIYSFVSMEVAEAGRAWQQEADFRRSGGSSAPLVTSDTVEQQLASLAPSVQVAIAAKVMSLHGHHKKRTTGTAQMELLPA